MSAAASAIDIPASYRLRASAAMYSRYPFIAATPVLNVADLLHDPHYRARKTFIEVANPLGFKETIYGSYVKMSRSQIDVRTGPRIGQDNEHVFKGLLGLSDAEYEALEREGVFE